MKFRPRHAEMNWIDDTKVSAKGKGCVCIFQRPEDTSLLVTAIFRNLPWRLVQGLLGDVLGAAP